MTCDAPHPPCCPSSEIGSDILPPMLPRGMIPSGVLRLFHGRGPQDNGRVPWYLPVLHGIKRRGATAAIARVLAGPQGLPLPLPAGQATALEPGSGAGRARGSRSAACRCRAHRRSGVRMLLDRAPRHPCRQGAAPHARRGPGVADGAGRGATHRSRVALALREVELRALERAGVFRVRQACLHRRVVQAAKLCEGCGTPLAHQPGECLWEIGEIKTGLRPRTLAPKSMGVAGPRRSTAVSAL